MNCMIVTQKVKNFESWKKVFAEQGAKVLPGCGLEVMYVFRDMNDESIAMVMCKITDREKAEAITEQALSQQDEDSDSDCGVIGTPEVQWISEEPLSATN